jgi:hypothetical protein
MLGSFSAIPWSCIKSRNSAGDGILRGVDFHVGWRFYVRRNSVWNGIPCGVEFYVGGILCGVEFYVGWNFIVSGVECQKL